MRPRSWGTLTAEDPEPGAGLLDWLEDASTSTGVWTPNGKGWLFTSYRELAARANTVAELIGGERSDRRRVAVLADSIVDFIPAVYGALCAGHSVTALSTPPVATNTEPFVDQARDRLRVGQHAHLLFSGGLHAVAKRTADMCSIGASEIPHAPTDRSVPRDRLDDRHEEAFLQFTSGSTSSPKGVSISRSAAAWGAGACLQLIEAESHDGLVTWLPFSHDMGLVGGVLSPTTIQANAWHMTPAEFIRRPRRWLECLGAMGATYAILPPFGLELLLRRAKPDDLDGLDLSGVKAIIVGAERVSSRLLERVEEFLGPAGLSQTALTPAYGLAEATLLVSGARLLDRAKVVKVEIGNLQPGQPVVQRPGAAGDDDETSVVVSCGPPAEGVGIRILDADSSELPPGHLGEIAVDSPSLASAHVTSSGATGQDPIQRPYPTGDLGFVLAGDLYVIGRQGDSLKRKGSTIHAEDIDVWLRDLEVSHGTLTRVTAVLGVAQGADVALVVADGELSIAASVLADRTTTFLGGVPAVVVRVERSDVPRTTSGKPRRRELWTGLIDGNLSRTVLSDEHHILTQPR